jgi:large subunit ribosomal protein L25
MATLQVKTRESAKSAEIGRLRKAGILPMALIEKGKGTRQIQAPQKDVKATLRAAGGVPVFGVQLDDSGSEFKVVLKEVQRDIISRNIIHITLQEVKEDDVIRIAVPIHFHGEPECVTKKRSSLMTPMVNIEVHAKPGDIPKWIDVDVSKMEDNDKVVVGDLKFPDGVTTHVSDDAVVATTFHMRAVSLEVPSGEAAAAAEGEAAEGEAKEGEGEKKEED